MEWSRLADFLKTPIPSRWSFYLGLVGGVAGTVLANGQVSDRFSVLLPHAIVCLTSVLFGIAELISEFEKDFSDAVTTPGGIGLLVFNAMTAEAVFFCILIQGEIESEVNQLWLAASVGFGFPTLIRTRFTLKKSPDPDREDFTVGIDWIYDAIQKHIKSEIARSLVPRKRTLVRQLCESYPTGEIYQYIKQALEERYLFAQEEAKQESAKADRIYNSNEAGVASLLAQKLLSLLGMRSIAALVEAKRQLPPDLFGQVYRSMSLEQQRISAQVESITRRYDLGDLIAIAKEQLTGEVLALAEEAIQDEDATEEERKIDIATILVANGILS